MSLWTTITGALKTVGSSILKTGGQVLGGILGGGGGATVPQVQPVSLPTVRTMPPISLPQTMPGGAPIATQIGQFVGQQLGITRGGPGVARMKRGRLTGNMIPAGFVERMSKQGVVYLGKSSRRRGISGRDLSTWRRVERVVSRIQRAHPMRRRK